VLYFQNGYAVSLNADHHCQIITPSSRPPARHQAGKPQGQISDIVSRGFRPRNQFRMPMLSVLMRGCRSWLIRQSFGSHRGCTRRNASGIAALAPVQRSAQPCACHPQPSGNRNGSSHHVSIRICNDRPPPLFCDIEARHRCAIQVRHSDRGRIPSPKCLRLQSR